MIEWVFCVWIIFLYCERIAFSLEARWITVVASNIMPTEGWGCQAYEKRLERRDLAIP